MRNNGKCLPPTILLLLAVTVAALVAPFTSRVVALRRYASEKDAILRLLEGWADRCPKNQDSYVWGIAVGTFRTAVNNIYFDLEPGTIEQLRALRRDIDARSAGPVTEETLRWLVQRLEQDGPDYMRRQGHPKEMFAMLDESRKTVEADAPGHEPVPHP